MDSIEILPLTHPVEEYYAQIRTDLEQQGIPIGGNDLLIAAHALTLNLTVITANVREFSRIPHLKVENWLKPDLKNHDWRKSSDRRVERENKGNTRSFSISPRQFSLCLRTDKTQITNLICDLGIS